MTRPPITGDQRFVKAINRNVLLRLLLDLMQRAGSAPWLRRCFCERARWCPRMR